MASHPKESTTSVVTEDGKVVDQAKVAGAYVRDVLLPDRFPGDYQLVVAGGAAAKGLMRWLG